MHSAGERKKKSVTSAAKWQVRNQEISIHGNNTENKDLYEYILTFAHSNFNFQFYI